MIQNDFLVKVKKELCKYQNIPKDFCDYMIEVIKKDKEKHLLPVILKDKERKIVLERINNQIKKAINITKLSPVKLFKALDFHSKDTKFSRFDAMFAELRVIIFLSKLNLYDVIPLKAKNEKSADFIAKGNSHKYAIEVFCKISKELKEEFKTNKIITNESDLIHYYLSKVEGKKSQLDKTAKKYLCDKKIIVMVLNDLNILNLLTYYEYPEILKKISTELDWGSNYHFAIVTGVTTLGIDIVENDIYPRITI